MNQQQPEIDGYLLDLNILRAWRNPANPDHSNVLAHINNRTREPFFISIVTLGEINYGHQLVGPAIQANVEFNEFIDEQFPYPLEIRRSSVAYYGSIKARLFEMYAPKDASGQRRRGLRAAQLVDPMTDLQLGVDENDIWIAANALEYNLTLVTHDSMTHIRKATSDLLRIDDWRIPPR